MDYKKELKVLSIGNSFSVDSMQYLYDIASDYGIEKIVLGNLYIGGASTYDHINQIENELNDYIYYKNIDGTWRENYNSTILDGLLDEDWDIINLQQVSHYAGLQEKYDESLLDIIKFVNENKTNTKSILVWNMTWAYESDSDHGGFAFYDNDQMIMYNAICESVKNKILTNNSFEYVIPTGTMIQNMRTIIGDNLTRDGFHLSFDKGRYFASLLWFHKITKLDISNISFKPVGVSNHERDIAKEVAIKSVQNPFTLSEVKL